MVGRKEVDNEIYRHQFQTIKIDRFGVFGKSEKVRAGENYCKYCQVYYQGRI